MKSNDTSWISMTPTGSQSPNLESPLDEQTKLLVNMVFARFKASYGHRFDSSYGDRSSLDIARREWGYCLRGYSESQLALALHKCKLTYAWPPSIAEFIALLQGSPEENGLPTMEAAYRQACSCRIDPLSFSWSHPIVYHVAHHIGFWRLKQSSETELRPVFERTYKEFVGRFLQGESFIIPQQTRLADKSSATTSHQIAELAEQLDMDPSHFYYMTLQERSPVRARFRKNIVENFPELQDKIPE